MRFRIIVISYFIHVQQIEPGGDIGRRTKPIEMCDGRSIIIVSERLLNFC